MKRLFKNLCGAVVIIGLIIFLLIWDFSKRVEGFFQRLRNITLVILAVGLSVALAFVVCATALWRKWLYGEPFYWDSSDDSSY